MVGVGVKINPKEFEAYAAEYAAALSRVRQTVKVGPIFMGEYLSFWQQLEKMPPVVLTLIAAAVMDDHDLKVLVRACQRTAN